MQSHKIALITGAAGSIGRALAIKFAAGGYHVALGDVDADTLGIVAKDIRSRGGECSCMPGNVEDDAYLRSFVTETLHQFGRIDVVINNAAWRTLGSMRDISLDEWEKTLRICLTAPAFLAKYAAEAMEKNNIPGVIVNISSVMAQRAGGSSPAYIAAKGALESLTYELAVLYGPRGIRVVAVSPGSIMNGLSGDYRDEAGSNIAQALSEHVADLTPLGRPGTPEEVANVCYWICSADASYVTGTTMLVDGGLQHNFNTYTLKKLQFPNEF